MSLSVLSFHYTNSNLQHCQSTKLTKASISFRLDALAHLPGAHKHNFTTSNWKTWLQKSPKRRNFEVFFAAWQVILLPANVWVQHMFCFRKGWSWCDFCWGHVNPPFWFTQITPNRCRTVWTASWDLPVRRDSVPTRAATAARSRVAERLRDPVLGRGIPLF